ncbi:hypothetical protein FA15DRAFT_760252 [Coprinopsis marcescibilis]|uniref:inositol-3-phosphate synthase n=1 Tax=Coprinopsis marcescibilis TaxID=230819 RepID=A0A5C3KTE7_COPMA|nr:hypothetical protein FA15DRAFT_760252 [Coprinopsis marcescibilis]
MRLLPRTTPIFRFWPFEPVRTHPYRITSTNDLVLPTDKAMNRSNLFSTTTFHARSLPTWTCLASPDFIAANNLAPSCTSRHHRWYGDNHKSGFTEFFANTGIEPLSIASCNHLDNNNEQNLSGKSQFMSKEISNSSVPLELTKKGTPKDRGNLSLPSSTFPSPLAIPSVPSILYGSHSVINISNECEGFSAAVVWSSTSSCKDSLLATSLVLDLSILAELLTRVNYRKVGEAEFKPYHLVLSLIFYRRAWHRGHHHFQQAAQRSRDLLQGLPWS